MRQGLCVVVLRREHASCFSHSSWDPLPILSALLCPPETISRLPGARRKPSGGAAVASTVFTQTPSEMLRGYARMGGTPLQTGRAAVPLATQRFGKKKEGIVFSECSF